MKKEKTSLLRKTSLKVTAGILVFILAIVLAGSGLGAFFLLEKGVYTTPMTTKLHEKFKDLTVSRAQKAFQIYTDSSDKNIKMLQSKYDAAFADSNIAGISLRSSKGNFVQWGSAADADSYCTCFAFRDDYLYIYQSAENLSQNRQQILSDGGEIISVNVSVSRTLTQKDGFYWMDKLVRLAYALRYWIYPIALLSLIGAVWCFVFLVRGAGLRKGEEAVHPWPTVKIPTDLWYCAAGLLVFLAVEVVYENLTYRGNILLFALSVPVLFYLLLFLCMEFAVRCRVGGFWKNTIFYRLGRWIFRSLRKIGSFLKDLFLHLPLIWKTGLFFVLLSGLHLLLLLFDYRNPFYLFLLWCIENLLLFPCILAAALMMRKLQKAGRVLAEGDMNYQTDTSGMVWDFKKHGENLNHIREGMSAAVEERLKSERMKTALITNVSHDIKTPLTSIINYSDLICKENCENEKVTEYAGVLYRQSERLKHLLDDLVEASKASTGNLEINLAPCEVGVLMTQTVGEYEEKLNKAGLELIVKKPDKPVMILADSRRLWRIFDNLVNNITKYAQPGTRVYLTLEEEDGNAVISFKNISKAVLDISPDELMERFVRGDSSRNSEGNGLGLSIGKSLAELQGGKLDLRIDGDLFKVILSFPKQKPDKK